VCLKTIINSEGFEDVQPMRLQLKVDLLAIGHLPALATMLQEQTFF